MILKATKSNHHSNIPFNMMSLEKFSYDSELAQLKTSYVFFLTNYQILYSAII
jgi:hypothetical protein